MYSSPPPRRSTCRASGSGWPPAPCHRRSHTARRSPTRPSWSRSASPRSLSPSTRALVNTDGDSSPVIGQLARLECVLHRAGRGDHCPAAAAELLPDPHLHCPPWPPGRARTRPRNGNPAAAPPAATGCGSIRRRTNSAATAVAPSRPSTVFDAAKYSSTVLVLDPVAGKVHQQQIDRAGGRRRTPPPPG